MNIKASIKLRAKTNKDYSDLAFALDSYNGWDTLEKHASTAGVRDTLELFIWLETEGYI